MFCYYLVLLSSEIAWVLLACFHLLMRYFLTFFPSWDAHTSEPNLCHSRINSILSKKIFRKKMKWAVLKKIIWNFIIWNSKIVRFGSYRINWKEKFRTVIIKCFHQNPKNLGKKSANSIRSNMQIEWMLILLVILLASRIYCF